MHMSLHNLIQKYRPLEVPMLQEMLRRLINVLDFLHTEAHIFHTGMRPMVGFVIENNDWRYLALCGFGEARIGKIQQDTGPFFQPHIYSAPEVAFEIPRGASVVIWNVATLVWDLLGGRHLFNNIGRTGSLRSIQAHGSGTWLR
ncbi:protein kinase [Histoplasma capsulatum var. duboisii H88]|uniref:Protein kinase n=1 Tax=Ajellomyces capsulatus (strain H88) TaxID=544711 RepID=A0A8A1LHY7_AJEC8|nr:protein kinase [Histoplasma capsulatum var. duboisii H88]